MPLNRIEQYLGNLRGDGNTIPDKPLNRIEKYLAIMCGEDYEIPKPLNRIEQYLADIAENGGGGGGGETVIVPETTITTATYYEPNYEAQVTGAFTLPSDGEEVTVTFDGVDYTIAAQDMDGEIILGVLTDDEIDFTDYPFFITLLDAETMIVITPTDAPHTVKVTGQGGGTTLITKTITTNGTYNASSDDADGYSTVIANVPNTYTAGDEGMVVYGGTLATQTVATYTSNGTYDTTLINMVGVNVSGGGGLKYEEGTFTPTEDIARPTISFANTHTVAPIAIIMIDATGIDAGANSDLCWEFFDFRKLDPAGVNFGGSTTYGYAFWYVRTSTSFTSGDQRFTTGTDSSITSDSPYYWATESAFLPYVNSASRYWRTGRTYKWIAVWAPSV